MVYTTTINSKGQLTIPAELRETLGLSSGSRVAIMQTGESEFTLRRAGSIADLRGCLAGMDVPKADRELNDLMGQRAVELDEATLSKQCGATDGEAA